MLNIFFQSLSWKPKNSFDSELKQQIFSIMSNVCDFMLINF